MVGKVVEGASDVDHFEGGAVTVQVDHRPQRLPGVDPAKEDAQIFSGNSKVDVPVPGNVIVYDVVLRGVALSQSLGPVP